MIKEKDKVLVYGNINRNPKDKLYPLIKTAYLQGKPAKVVWKSYDCGEIRVRFEDGYETSVHEKQCRKVKCSKK